MDVTQASGIDFQHHDPATPMHYIQETLGSGVAWIDYNNDGLRVHNSLLSVVLRG